MHFAWLPIVKEFQSTLPHGSDKGANKMKYKIWRTNRFNETILSELVAEFDDLELAKDFVEYQASLGNSYAILKDGVRIDEW